MLRSSNRTLLSFGLAWVIFTFTAAPIYNTINGWFIQRIGYPVMPVAEWWEYGLGALPILLGTLALIEYWWWREERKLVQGGMS